MIKRVLYFFKDIEILQGRVVYIFDLAGQSIETLTRQEALR